MCVRHLAYRPSLVTNRLDSRDDHEHGAMNAFKYRLALLALGMLAE